jgi:hypothetical protein
MELWEAQVHNRRGLQQCGCAACPVAAAYLYDTAVRKAITDNDMPEDTDTNFSLEIWAKVRTAMSPGPSYSYFTK